VEGNWSSLVWVFISLKEDRVETHEKLRPLLLDRRGGGRRASSQTASVGQRALAREERPIIRAPGEKDHQSAPDNRKRGGQGGRSVPFVEALKAPEQKTARPERKGKFAIRMTRRRVLRTCGAGKGGSELGLPGERNAHLSLFGDLAEGTVDTSAKGQSRTSSVGGVPPGYSLLVPFGTPRRRSYLPSWPYLSLMRKGKMISRLRNPAARKGAFNQDQDSARLLPARQQRGAGGRIRRPR